MKERPILFGASMVRAILAGTKTQTRRVVKPQPTHFNPAGVPRRARPDAPSSDVIRCPYGQPGDRLWVRETWNWFDPDGIPEVRRGRRAPFTGQQGAREIPWVAAYAADGHLEHEHFGCALWRPSIHMPRWASRILLEITAVSVERLQDISHADAVAEGMAFDDAIYEGYSEIVWNLSDAPQQGENMNHKLDTDQQVFFYEQDFYVLSNFSAFRVKWQGIDFDTSEHAYHWEKFRDHPDAWNAAGSIAEQVRRAPSAHSAFKLAERCKPRRRPDWDDVKVKIMRGILKAKVDQHEYVRRKLLETGTRELVEDSWRDDFWGWGPNKDGKNMLGRLWMEIREELRAASQCGMTASFPHENPNSLYEYSKLWEKINGTGSWDANPWVWVVEFQRV